MNDAPWQLIRRLEAENDQLTAEVAEYRAANTRMQELVVIRAKERDDALFSAEQRTAEVERLKARVAELEDDAELLSALQAAGVDNWGGYDVAHEILREWRGGGESPC